MQKIPVIILVILFTVSLYGYSQDLPADTISLEEVSVSVLPFEEKYLEATGSIFLLGSQTIEQNTGISTADLYNSAPGVYMASGALNNARIVIRGIGSRTPYTTNRIKAYLDDIPLTSGDGISSLEDQDPLALGSIEVLRGPASALYGAGLGGIIKLNSPGLSDPGMNLSLFTEAGSFQSQKYGIRGGYKTKDLNLIAGFARSSTDGYRENSQYTRSNAFLHAAYQLDRHTLKFTFSLVDLNSGIPSSLNQDDFLNNPQKAGGSWGNIGGYEAYLKILGGLKLESKISRNFKNNLVLFSTFSDPYERRPFNILDERSYSMGFREYIEYWGDHLKVSAGVELFLEKYNWQTYETLTEGKGELLSDYGETRNYINTFLLAQWRATANILIDAGFNVNFLSYGLTDHYLTDSVDQGGQYSYDPVFSPRVGINIAHNSSIHTYLSAGHGFSAPSLEETLMPEGNINTSLKPETGWNMELGNRGSLWKDRLVYDLALYSIYLKNLLVTERLEEDIFTGVNAGTALNSGFELFVKGTLYPEKDTEGFNTKVSVAYNYSRNVFLEFVDEGTDYSGNQLPGIPQQELNSRLDVMLNGIVAGLQYRYSGSQWLTDVNDLSYEGYHRFDVNLGWNFKFGKTAHSLKLYGGIKNVFDVNYASMILINAPSFGPPPRYYYPGNPREFYVGLRLNY